MSLDTLVSVSVTATTATPSGPSFTTPLIATYHTLYADRVRAYTSLAAVTADGFATTSHGYLAAQVAFAQNPRPPIVKIGRRALAATQTLTVQALDATVGDTFNITVAGKAVTYTVPNGFSTTITGVSSANPAVVTTAAAHGLTSGDSVHITSVTDSGGASPVNGDQVVTVLSPTTFSVPVNTASSHTYVSGGTLSWTTTNVAASINARTVTALATTPAVTGVTPTSATDTMTLTMTSGTRIDLTGWSQNLAIAETTTDPGVATDLAAILAADPGWYGLSLTGNSKAEVLAAAAWAEANRKIFIATSSDTACGTSATTDVMSTLQSSNYAYTGCIFNGKQLANFAGAGWISKMLAKQPGSATWKFKSIAGVLADDDTSLTETQVGNIQSKNGNWYKSIASVPITQNGTSASGAFLDVTHFIDWLRSNIQINVFAQMANADKIPFTDAGVDAIKALVSASLRQGIAVGGLASSPAPVVTAPLVANVSVTDRLKRNLPNVSFTATLSGALHSIQITGTVSV